MTRGPGLLMRLLEAAGDIGSALSTSAPSQEIISSLKSGNRILRFLSIRFLDESGLRL
jgi:hypothetical protein